MSVKYVEIEKDGVSGKVLRESVPAWERNGWTVVDDGSSESGTEPVAAATDTSAQTDAKPVTADTTEGGASNG